MKKSNGKENLGKKLDQIAKELGATIKGMTTAQKRRFTKQQTQVEKTVKAREEQIQSTLTEMVDVIEKYFLATPFGFIEGTEGECASYCFPDPRQNFTDSILGLNTRCAGFSPRGRGSTAHNRKER